MELCQLTARRAELMEHLPHRLDDFLIQRGLTCECDARVKICKSVQKAWLEARTVRRAGKTRLCDHTLVLPLLVALRPDEHPMAASKMLSHAISLCKEEEDKACFTRRLRVQA